MKKKAVNHFLPKIEINRNNGKVHIDGANVNYSFGSLHYVFKRIIRLYKNQITKSKEILILGFGAGSIAKILINDHQYSGKIIGVEAEPKMFDLAKEYAGINTWEDIEYEVELAENYLQKSSKQFACIFIDLFVEDEIPKPCLSHEFICNLEHHLKDDGIILWNCLTHAMDKLVLAKTLNDSGYFHINEVEITKENVLLAISKS